MAHITYYSNSTVVCAVQCSSYSCNPRGGVVAPQGGVGDTARHSPYPTTAHLSLCQGSETYPPTPFDSFPLPTRMALLYLPPVWTGVQYLRGARWCRLTCLASNFDVMSIRCI